MTSTLGPLGSLSLGTPRPVCFALPLRMTVKRQSLAFGTASTLVDVVGRFVVRWAEGTVKVDSGLLKQQHDLIETTWMKDLCNMATVHQNLVYVASESSGVLNLSTIKSVAGFSTFISKGWKNMVVNKGQTDSIIRAAKAVAELPSRVGALLLSLRQALADVVKGGDAMNYLRVASRCVAEVVLALSFQECMVSICKLSLLLAKPRVLI
jgi:hypothetical protein